MTPDQQIRAVAVITNILKKSGTIFGRIRLQKLVYLLQQEGVAGASEFTFFYHHYGPYSEDLADFLKRAVWADAVRESKESFDDEWQRYEYTLGPSGDKYAQLLHGEEDEKKIEAAVERTKDKHWRALELAATALYIEKLDGLTRDAALERSIMLKTACADFRNDAVEILNEFGF